MTARHLGKRIYELVDGRLSRADAYVAMAHLEECEECSARWHALLQDREALQTSGTGIDMSFAASLLNRDRIAEIAREEPRRHAKIAEGRGRNLIVVAAATLLAGAAVLGILWELGAPPEVGLDIAAAPDRSEASSVQLLGAPTMRLDGSLVSWVHPEWDESNIIPVEAAVIENADGSIVLVATVLAGLDPITVTEKRGRLPGDLADEMPVARVGDRDIYVVSQEPAQILFDSGDVVVGLGCECSVDLLQAVAGEFPDGREPGVIERLGDGLEVVADAVTGG